MRPTAEQIEAGTFLADVGAFNAVYESCYRKVRAARVVVVLSGGNVDLDALPWQAAPPAVK